MALMDPNHDEFNSMFQMIEGSWETFMVHYVLDTWIIKLSRVSQELRIIQDYDSNLLVISIASVKKLGKINMVEKYVRDQNKS